MISESGRLLAEALFRLGDEPNSKCYRIAFVGGGWGSETNNGGLSQEPLAKELSILLEPLLEAAKKEERERIAELERELAESQRLNSICEHATKQYNKIQDFVIKRRLFNGQLDHWSHADIVLNLAEDALSQQEGKQS